VDRAVDTIITALSDTGRLSDTLIVFASDNGLAYGEHRWIGKWVPYEESIHVPTVVRYDPITSPSRSDSHLILNLDFAPTFAALAGVSAPKAKGSSLLPLLSGASASWRKDFLFEHLESNEGIPSYCAVRTARYAYVRYTDTGERELYDLRQDPFELQNTIDDPAYAFIAGKLAAKEQKRCSSPPPPVAVAIRRQHPVINPSAA
jgi:arylsulfatase A-like enzyme